MAHTTDQPAGDTFFSALRQLLAAAAPDSDRLPAADDPLWVAVEELITRLQQLRAQAARQPATPSPQDQLPRMPVQPTDASPEEISFWQSLLNQSTTLSDHQQPPPSAASRSALTQQRINAVFRDIMSHHPY